MVLDPTTGIKKVTIPRNTFFTVANTIFSIQYPIEIRQLAHGGIQIVYDATIVSPLQTLSTNIIAHEIKQNTDGSYIAFDVYAQQFDIISQTGSLSSAIDFSIDININDLYYYTRVYVEDANGNWGEIHTTHSDQIYDIATPTAVINVVNNVVTVSIPQIYTGTGVLANGIRIDVYETKGAMDLILWEYPITAFVATWQAYDNADLTQYVAPLKTFNSIIICSTNVVSGGTNEVSFLNLRSQVISNAIGAPSLPITNAQAATALAVNGYSIVKNIDTITNRVFLATRGMPLPVDVSLITPAAASMATVFATITDLIQINTVIDNGASVTITPDTIYQDINGIVTPLTSNQLKTLLSSTIEKLALNVTQNNYLYTPFHFVLDMTSNLFNVRPYYLDSPSIDTKLFVSENDTTMIQVNTGSYAITRTATGYAITVITQSGNVYKAIPDDQVQAQLAYTPYGEVARGYLNGTFIGRDINNERIFTFDISTNFNVNNNDNIELSTFLMYNTTPRLTAANLLTDFDIFYTTDTPVGSQWIPANIDQMLGLFILPTNVIGITHEVLRTGFGYALSTLWSRSRSVISSTPYKTWPVDVPRLYETDIYQRDINGSAITIDANGMVSTTLLHAKGDPVLDSSGNPSYQHYAGDVVVDAAGLPIPANPRNMLRQISIMLLEGAYWFANDLAASNYRTLLTRSIVDWLTNDIANLSTEVLEQTRVYFYPNTTLGTISAVVDNGIVKNITAGQTFVVNLSVSNLVYQNLALRTQLETATIKTIRDQLTQATVSVDSIISALRLVYGGDVISTSIGGLGGADNLTVITCNDDSVRCSINKKLTALPNNSLIVEENVTCNFLLYKIGQ